MRAAIAFVKLHAVTACGASRTVAVTPCLPQARPPLQRLQADLSAIFEAQEFERSFWSVLVSPADRVTTHSLNAAKLMMPGPP